MLVRRRKKRGIVCYHSGIGWQYEIHWSWNRIEIFHSRRSRVRSRVTSYTLPARPACHPRASEVTLHLKNQGEEPFRHEEYGNTIIITRKFTKEGGSSWKIKSADGRVISTKKDELSAICDHMNIQVDNPMTILTQGTAHHVYRVLTYQLITPSLKDSARQFLSASAPRDKYKVRNDFGTASHNPAHHQF